MKSILALVLCTATACAAQELSNCQTRACRSFKELLAARDPVVMRSDKVCFYAEKFPFGGEGGSADQFFLLNTKPNRKLSDGREVVDAKLGSIEVADGQPSKDEY
jgi:hypothetical protein